LQDEMNSLILTMMMMMMMMMMTTTTTTMMMMMMMVVVMRLIFSPQKIVSQHVARKAEGIGLEAYQKGLS